jgi:hypothetical protein
MTYGSLCRKSGFNIGQQERVIDGCQNDVGRIWEDLTVIAVWSKLRSSIIQ